MADPQIKKLIDQQYLSITEQLTRLGPKLAAGDQCVVQLLSVIAAQLNYIITLLSEQQREDPANG
jgi:hypothetical protein